jgi:hypothetical protein
MISTLNTTLNVSCLTQPGVGANLSVRVDLGADAVATICMHLTGGVCLSVPIIAYYAPQIVAQSRRLQLCPVNGFVYESCGVVALTPGTGRYVSIDGSEFGLPPFAGVSVTFGGYSCVINASVSNLTRLLCRTTAISAPGTYPVVVTAGGQPGTTSPGRLAIPPYPAVRNVSGCASQSTAAAIYVWQRRRPRPGGGQRECRHVRLPDRPAADVVITVAGDNVRDVYSVTVDSVDCSDLTTLADGSVTCRLPAGTICGEDVWLGSLFRKMCRVWPASPHPGHPL